MVSQSTPEQNQMGAQASENAISDTDAGTIDDSVNYLQSMDRIRTRLSNDSLSLHAQQKSQNDHSFDAGATYKRDSDRAEAPYRNASNQVVQSTQQSEQLYRKRMVRTKNMFELFHSQSHQPMKRKYVPRQPPFNSTNSEGSGAEPSQHNGCKERLRSSLPQPHWRQSVV
jgi:hypothetical protein